MKQLHQKFRLQVLVITTLFIFKINAQPPLFDQWESNMTTWGDHWGVYLQTYELPANPESFDEQEGIYYDAQRIYFQIADYTGQTEPWNSYAQEAEYIYRYYLDARWNYNNTIPWFAHGWRRFSHGIMMDAQRTADPISIDGVIKIRDNPAFSNPENWGYDNPNQTWYWSNYSREVAYALSSHVMAERMGNPRNEIRVPIYIDMVLNHINEWITGDRGNPDTTKHRFAPFMAGLTAEALIDYYKWEVEQGHNPDNTIPDTLKQLADYMWTATVYDGVNQGEPMWIADIGGTGYPHNDQGGTGVGAFRYEDRENPISAIDGTGLLSPELNLLIAPLYAWVFKHFGDTTYIERGDLIWEGGVDLSNVGWNTKIYNQNYRWSFDYIKWRNEGMQALNIDEVAESEIQIYPNPVTNIFTINLKDETLEKVIIYNQLGQQVKEISFNDVDISNLSNGIYFVKIVTQNDKITIKKVIKN